MSGKGNSKANTASTTTSTNTQVTTNTVDNSIYTTTTDAGALAALTDIGTKALQLVGDIFGEASDTSYSAIDANARLADASSERVERFAGTALQTNADVSTSALNTLRDAGAGILDFAAGLFDTALKSNATLTDTSNSAIAGLAKANTATSDDRFTKLVTVVVIGVAAVLILPRIWKAA